MMGGEECAAAGAGISNQEQQNKSLPPLQPVQAMKTAMKASRKIKTPPAIGITNGIIGTMSSIGSCSGATVSWLAGTLGVDMGFLTFVDAVILP